MMMMPTASSLANDVPAGIGFSGARSSAAVVSIFRATLVVSGTAAIGIVAVMVSSAEVA